MRAPGMHCCEEVNKWMMDKEMHIVTCWGHEQ